MVINDHPTLVLFSNVMRSDIIFGTKFLDKCSVYLDYKANQVWWMGYDIPLCDPFVFFTFLLPLTLHSTWSWPWGQESWGQIYQILCKLHIECKIWTSHHPQSGIWTTTPIIQSITGYIQYHIQTQECCYMQQRSRSKIISFCLYAGAATMTGIFWFELTVWCSWALPTPHPFANDELDQKFSRLFWYFSTFFLIENELIVGLLLVCCLQNTTLQTLSLVSVSVIFIPNLLS